MFILFPLTECPPPPQSWNIQLYVCWEISSLAAIMANKMLSASGQAQYTNLTPSQPLYDGVTRQIFRKNVILTIITHTWLHERCIGRFKGTGYNCLPPKKRFLNTVKKLRETLERWTSLCSEIQVKPMSVHSLHLHLSHYTHPTLIQSMDP